MDLQKIADRIREGRQRLHLTQQQLADRLSVTNKAVSKWERAVSLPDIALLLPLCRCLDIPVQELLSEDDPETNAMLRQCLSMEEQKEGTAFMEQIAFQKLTIHPEDREPLSPYLFGHNLEHTRACVNGGLSAQMIRNRKFAGKPSKNLGCAAEFFPIGSRVLYLTDHGSYTQHKVKNNMSRRNELQSLWVQNLTDGAAGMGQHGMDIVAGKKYELRMVAKCSLPVELTVALTDRDGKQSYAETVISLQPGEDWTTYCFDLTPCTSDQNADIRWTFAQRTGVHFGVLSMLPEGHFRGMRRDVIQHLKELGVSLLRWPGGNFAGEYRWQDGLLPVDMRGPMQAALENEGQPYTHGYDYHEINTDDFVALCREVGAEPFITINAVWDSPQENAAWVEYCNGPADSEYGKLRAAAGHPEPYNVKFWSLGNEMGYGHMEGPKNAEGYAAMARAQAEAMLQKDPNLKLFSSGPYPAKEWVENSAKVLEDIASYVSLHYYAYTNMDYTTPEGIQATYEAMVAAPEVPQGLIRQMREYLGEHCLLSFDEWNWWYAWYRPTSAPEGIFAALMMHMVFGESGPCNMPVCCYFQPVGEGAIQIQPHGSFLTAIGQVFSTMKVHKGGELCRIEGQQKFEATASVKDGLLTVTLVNTNYDLGKSFVLEVPGKFVSGTLLEPEDMLPHSRMKELPLGAAEEDGAIRVELPAHSVAMVQIALAE